MIQSKKQRGNLSVNQLISNCWRAHWRELARQHPILYNSEKKAKSVGYKIEDMRSRLCFLYSGISGCLWMHVEISIDFEQKCVRCQAMKNKIKNYATDKVKNCDIVDDKERRQFSKFKVCALSQSWDIRRNVPPKITEPSMEPPCWRTSLVLQYGGQ